MEKLISSKVVPISADDFGRTLFDGLNKNSSTVLINDELEGRKITCGEIVNQSETLARHLLRNGCNKDDVIAIFSPNSIEWFVVMTSAFRIGAVTAGINSLLVADELRHVLELCQPKYIYTTNALASNVKEAISGLKHDEACPTCIVKGEYADCLPLESLFKFTSDLPPLSGFECRPHDPGLILFSSGTTGLPKAVLLTHRNLQASVAFLSQPAADGILFDNMVTFAPFAHAVGCFSSLGCATRGFRMHVLQKFDFIKYLQVIEAYKITNLLVVPPVATRLAKSPEVAKYRLDSIKTITCTAAPLSSTIEDELMVRFPGATIRQGYGLTETTGFIIAVPGEGPRKPGSIGRLICNTEVKMVDTDDGSTLGHDKPGEMYIRSPQIMSCYLRNPEATVRAIDNEGWLHTGDVAYYDTDGYIYIVDRIKELIKYNANQVAPAELEAVLLSHPRVADACVFGLPDTEAGELPAACVVRRQGAAITEVELEQFVAGKVASFKKLRGGVKFVATIMKSPSGKILRRLMRNSLLNGKL